MSWLSKLFDSGQKHLTLAKDSFKSKKDMAKFLTATNPWELDKNNLKGSAGEYYDKINTGGKLIDAFTGKLNADQRDVLRKRWGNAGGGAVGGAITGGRTGGPWGALVGAGLGGIVGYQDKRPATGERVGQKALMGAAIGYGAGSGMSALGSGGTGWSLGLGSGAGAGSGSSSTAGVNGLTSAPKAGGMSWGSIAKLGLGNAMQNQGNQMQGQDDELQRQQFLQRLMLLKQAQADRLRKIYGGA